MRFIQFGKKSAPNIARITAMDFKPNYFQTVLTSGEALRQHMKRGRIAQKRFYPIERTKGDSAEWSLGLNIEFVSFEEAEAILLLYC